MGLYYILKNGLNFIYFYLFISLCCTACGILVPRPGVEPGPTAAKESVESYPLGHQGISKIFENEKVNSHILDNVSNAH